MLTAVTTLAQCAHRGDDTRSVYRPGGESESGKAGGGKSDFDLWRGHTSCAFSANDPVFSTNDRAVSTNDPAIFASDPAIFANDPDIFANDPAIFANDRAISGK